MPASVPPSLRGADAERRVLRIGLPARLIEQLGRLSLSSILGAPSPLFSFLHPSAPPAQFAAGGIVPFAGKGHAEPAFSPKASSSISIQCLTGTGDSAARWVKQPMLAVATACGRQASSVSSLRARSACASAGCKIE